MLSVVSLPKWLASRERVRGCSTVVMHATAGGSLSGALETLVKRGISYHYLIDKSGLVTKCVPVSRVAYHAGVSVGPEGPSVNLYSVGISFVNWNNGADAYTSAQVVAARELVLALKDQLGGLRYLTTHRQVSWPRKNDPVGAVFLRKMACDVGLEYWVRSGVPE
jgi:N-acetyl-anhydromuramyl-L-alanine amidase AmpD